MDDLVPLAIFVGCVLATIGLMQLCSWLAPPAFPSASGAARDGAKRAEEASQ